MKIIRSSKQLQKILRHEREKGRSVGFVPTMGALHEGHLALARAADKENDITVVSIFVNPAQFGRGEDYGRYPRVFAADRKKLQGTGTDYLFYPSIRAMYPEGFSTFVEVDPRLSSVLCGKFRPGHFRGVATVVAKLLNITGPCRLYLGAKDFQQAVVVRRVIEDLNMDVCVRVMPTVREKDGLAMSSRNRYLNASERRRAAAIFRTLQQFRRDLFKKRGSIVALKARAVRELRANVDRVQYFELVDPGTLAPLRHFKPVMIALTACFVGKTRLIDNVIIRA